MTMKQLNRIITDWTRSLQTRCRLFCLSAVVWHVCTYSGHHDGWWTRLRYEWWHRMATTTETPLCISSICSLAFQDGDSVYATSYFKTAYTYERCSDPDCDFASTLAAATYAANASVPVVVTSDLAIFTASAPANEYMASALVNEYVLWSPSWNHLFLRCTTGKNTWDPAVTDRRENRWNSRNPNYPGHSSFREFGNCSPWPCGIFGEIGSGRVRATTLSVELALPLFVTTPGVEVAPVWRSTSNLLLWLSTLPPEIYSSCFFCGRVNFFYSVTVSGAGRFFFLSSWRVTVFDPGGINFFYLCSFSSCVKSVTRQQTRQLLDPDTVRRQERTVHKNPYHDRLYLHFILWAALGNFAVRNFKYFRQARVVN